MEPGFYVHQHFALEPISIKLPPLRVAPNEDFVQCYTRRKHAERQLELMEREAAQGGRLSSTQKS